MNTPDPSHELSRRELLRRGVAGLVFLAGAASLVGGCASSRSTAGTEAEAPLPDINWPRDPLASASRKGPAVCTKPMPQPTFADLPSGVLPRSAWARAGQITTRMDRADRPYSWITVHHDGINAFTNPSQAAAAARLETIRNAHLNRPGEPFGDIGYHYIIDPAGRVWQGRPIQWQGAHVRGENPGNLGICMLGNYNDQTPNRVQIARLNQFVAEQMRVHRIALSNVRTHQEWPSAHTECPGNSLQAYMRSTRASSGDLTRIVRA